MKVLVCILHIDYMILGLDSRLNFVLCLTLEVNYVTFMKFCINKLFCVLFVIETELHLLWFL